MNDFKIKPIYRILNNKYLRKVVILTPLVIMLVLTAFMVMINHGTIDMELTDFMVNMFWGSLGWLVVWMLIIIHTKNQISRHVLRQQTKG